MTEIRCEALAGFQGAVYLTYHSHKTSGVYLAGWILEQHLVRPVLRIPGASLTVRRLAEAAGYVIRPSQAGRLNQIVIDMWGGLEAAAADLSGPVRKLLDVLTPAPDMKDGPLQTSLVVNRLPYLTADHAQSLLGLDEAGTRAELDFELIKNGTVGHHPPQIDFAVIADGRLILGGAKKNDRLASQRREEQRKLSRLYAAARDLTADDVCLATAAAAWDPGTVELADGALGALGIGCLYAEGLGAGQPE